MTAPPPSTRTRILLATLGLVDEQGVDAVTHRAVAARAGVSPGSTTHHFSSRDDLLGEAFRFYLRGSETWLRRLLDEPGNPGDGPVERVRRRVVAILDREFAEGFVRAEYELILYASRDRELATEVRAWEARLVAMCAEQLEAAGVERPVTAGRILGDLVRGYELERLLDPTRTLAEFESRLDLLLAALIPPRP